MSNKLMIISTLLFIGCSEPSEDNSYNEITTSPTDTIVTTQKEDYVWYELKDSTFVQGAHVVILLPDSIRFNSYLDNGEEWIYEVDSDFGFAISGALDSLEKEKFFKNVKTTSTENRYVIIQRNYNQDLIIDRDTLEYSLLLTAPNKVYEIVGSDMIAGESYYYDHIKAYFLQE